MGVQDLCSMCTRCYDYCPANAVPAEKGTFMGTEKWTVNHWRCRHNIQIGMDKHIDCKYLHAMPGCMSLCKTGGTLDEPVRTDHLGPVPFGSQVPGEAGSLAVQRLGQTQSRETSLQSGESRIRESQVAGFPDQSKLWMTEGAYSEDARHKYATEIYPGGNLGGAGVKGFGEMFPLYSEEDKKAP